MDDGIPSEVSRKVYLADLASRCVDLSISVRNLTALVAKKIFLTTV